MTNVLVGALLILAAGALFLWAKRRAFSRTNPFGVERFPTYFRKLTAKTLDLVLLGGAVALGTSGVIVLAFAYEDSWGWLVLVPIYLFLIYLLLGT